MAALDLFAGKGYERTTFEDVAARIGLTKGAVYWHFKSKFDLFTELVADMTDQHNAELARMLPAPGSLDGLVEHFVERALLIVGKPVNRKYFQMMLSMDWPSAKFMPIKRRLSEINSNPFLIIKGTLTALQSQGELRADADVATTTALLGALWLGAMKMQVDKSLEADLAKTIRQGFNAVIHAIKA